MREHRPHGPGHHSALIAEKLGRGPKLPAAERRRAILETACGLFTERGYLGATTAEIARTAGISEPILYRHFGSKRALYFACLEEAWAQLRALGESALESKDSWPAIADAYMKARERVRLVDLWLQALPEASSDPQLRRFLKKQLREVHDFFAEAIREGQRRGAIHEGRDPEAEAWIFLAGGLLVTIDNRLGGLLGEDLAAVKRERRRWLLTEPE